MDVTKRVDKTGLAGADALYLRARQDNARHVPVDNQIVKLGPAVLDLNLSCFRCLCHGLFYSFLFL